MLLVVEGGDGCCLNRTGHHQATVLANLAQVPHEVGVAGVETSPATGEVRALGERVQRKHIVGAVLQDRLWRSLPGEFDVALVGEHGDVVFSTEGRRSSEIVDTARRISGCVDPQAQCSGGVIRVDGGEVDAPLLVDRHGDGSTAREDGTLLVARVRHLGIEHGVAVGPTHPQIVRGASDELLGAHGGPDLCHRIDVDIGDTSHPSGGGLSERE